jgi:hypothetical protein
MHGGRREGAGRPRGSGNGPTVEIRSVSMPPAAWEKLDELKGESSRGYEPQFIALTTPATRALTR